MILLDENIRDDQAIQLRRWHIPARFLVEDFTRVGTQDAEIIPILHRLKGATLFTHDRDFFRRDLTHQNYCLIWLEVFDGKAAEFIRALLKHDLFDTAAKRMGIVARAHHDGIDFWQRNRPALRRVQWA
jgi:predicted nuclease of predicted toxin-antitoxin system